VHRRDGINVAGAERPERQPFGAQCRYLECRRRGSWSSVLILTMDLVWVNLPA